MQMKALSRDEQYQFLEQNELGDFVREKLGGDFHRLNEVITLTRQEYLDWILTKPLQEDDWLRKSPSTQDGVYFLQRSESWWTVYQQDRGTVLWQHSFSTYEDARACLEIDYGVGRFLYAKKEIQAEQNEATNQAGKEFKNRKPEPVKHWWRFW